MKALLSKDQTGAKYGLTFQDEPTKQWKK